MKIDKMEFIVFDVETTGLNPLGGDRIIEIAAVKMKGGKKVDVFDSLINPQRPLSEHAQRINKITPEMVSSAPNIQQVLPKFLDFIGGGCLVAHNAKFDLDFLCHELAMIGRRLRPATPAWDTLKMAKELLPQINNYQLFYIAHFLGVKVEETHRALADARLTADVFLRLLPLAREKQLYDFRRLHENFSVPKPEFVIEKNTQGLLF